MAGSEKEISGCRCARRASRMFPRRFYFLALPGLTFFAIASRKQRVRSQAGHELLLCFLCLMHVRHHDQLQYAGILS